MVRSHKKSTRATQQEETVLPSTQRPHKTSPKTSIWWIILSLILLGSGVGFYIQHTGIVQRTWERRRTKAALWTHRVNQLQADNQQLSQRLQDLSGQVTATARGTGSSLAFESFKREITQRMAVLAAYVLFSETFYQSRDYTHAYQDLARMLPEDIKTSAAFQQLGLSAAQGLPSVGQILKGMKASYHRLPETGVSFYERVTHFLSAFIHITTPETLQLRHHLETLVQEGKLKEALAYRQQNVASHSIDAHLIDERLRLLTLFDQFSRQLRATIWETT